MRYLAFAFGLVLAATTARADMFPDASNAKLPETLVNFGYGTQMAASVKCTTVNASTAVTACLSTAGLKPGMQVRGTGVAAGTSIAGGITATGFTLSAPASASGTPVLTIRHYPFWSDDGGQPPIWRYPGRVFIGNAVGMPDARHAHPYWSWCSGSPGVIDCNGWAPRDSDLVVMSSRGGMAITGMSRTSDNIDIAGPMSAIGVSGFLQTDAINRGGHAGYFDVQHESTGRYAFGLEIALKDKTPGSGMITSFSSNPGVYGIRLSAGGDASVGGDATTPAQTGIHIASIMGGGPPVQPYSFNKGIVFQHNALYGTDGYSGCCGSAIEMAPGHMVRWQTPTGLGFGITSVVRDPVGQLQMFVQENVLAFLGNSGTSKIYEMWNTPDAVNYLQIHNAVSGATPEYAAASTVDPNVSVSIRPQGTGTVDPKGGLKLPEYTVASLPTCNAAWRSVMVSATTATAPTYNAPVVGGGAVVIPVMCDGAVWRAH